MSHSLINLYVTTHPDDAPELDKLMDYAADRLSALQAAVDRFYEADSFNFSEGVTPEGHDAANVKMEEAFSEIVRLASPGAIGDSK